MNKPCLVSIRDREAVVFAESLEAATKFAKNYLGDASMDYRNTNKVVFKASEVFGGRTFYVFSF